MTSSETIKPMMVKMKPTQGIYPRSSDFKFETLEFDRLGPVVTDRFDRATFHRFLAKRFFLGRLGLLVNVGVSAVVVPLEIGGGGFAAQIAVDALFIDVEFAGCVLGIFVGDVGHDFTLREREGR